MKEFISKYRTEVIISVAIAIVIFVPYFILNSGLIKSEDTLLMVDTATKYFSPLVIGALISIIVYKSIKRNREED